MTFQCTLCSKSFKLRHQLERHLSCVHDGERNHVCSTCQQAFSRKDALLRHQRKHGIEEMIFPCEECDSVFLRKDSLLRHAKTHRPLLDNKRPPTAVLTNPQSDIADTEPPSKRRRTSNTGGLNVRPHEDEAHADKSDSSSSNCCDTGGDIHHHAHSISTNEPADTGSAETEPLFELEWKVDPMDAGNTPMPAVLGQAPSCDPEDLGKLYRKHWADIRSRFQTKGKIKNTYNFRLQTMSNEEVITRARQVFENQTTAFKVNVGFGFFLRNVETCQVQYYYASHNTSLLSEPALVTDSVSFERFLGSLSSNDPLEHVRRARPNSKWVVETLTNVVFHIYKLKNHPIGGAPEKLPEYLTNKKAIVALQKNQNSGKLYHDNLCFFRSLALHRGSQSKSLEKMSKKLYKEMFTTPISQFKGISLEKMQDAEKQFKVNIVVYELVELQEDSDSLDISCNDTKVAARLVRRSLGQHEDTMYLNLHEDHFSYIKDISAYTCSYQCRKCLTLWKDGWQLQRHEQSCEGAGVKHTFPGGIYVHPKNIFELLEEEGIHIPEDIRYHPYRAVFDFECCFAETGQNSQTSKLAWEARHVPLSVSVCSNVPRYEIPECFISNSDSTQLLKEMLTYLTEIAEVSATLLKQTYAPYIEEIESRIASEAEEFQKMCQERAKQARPRQHYLKTLLDKLLAYSTEMPVIGFNSGSYDLNLVKEFLFPWMVENDPLTFIIKRNNNYMAVKSKNLLFLDITNFIAPGFSYDAFLRAYECSQQKGFFPYEWISFQNLHDRELPPHDAFYSDLKKSNITTEEYAYCQSVWQEEGMETMVDFLRWYNNRDVFPFLEALEKMSQFYRERNIDVFKDGISVPGLTMRYLFQMANGEPFSLFREKDKDLYYTFRDNQVGGPSIIFNRYQEAGKTKIRDSENVCQRIVGFDANALYLWAIMQNMPTGPYLRRKEETGFKREKSRPISIEWLEWCSHRDGVHIQHQWNGKEKCVGVRRIPVDGFCKETNTVYQFHGCYWHAHDCHLNANKGSTEEEKQTFQKRRQNTVEIREYIRRLGYNYEEVWECEFHDQKYGNPLVTDFLHLLQLPLEESRKLSSDAIIHAIRDGHLFGVIECDIHVPDELRSKFAEMCPIFKNTEISVEDIGDHMKTFASQHDIMHKPRRSLIGSMFGEKILLATPLLKWYLEKGLKVIRIYQVIEFKPKTCFKAFGEAVSDARRAGDLDPTKAIIADTMKLIGNSSYGKTITNKENHRNISIVSEDKASLLLNKVTFRDLNEISSTCFEVESSKAKIAMDLPLQIGFFVYQYAKLRMLQFYYDFLDKYFDRAHWEYVEMDTDSAYIAVASEEIDDLVKPELREMYEEDKHNWFPRTDTQEHARYDKRTPGLFKVEWEGDGIVALNSKMYYCFGEGKHKFSCKGINKKRNDVRKEIYMDVLMTTLPHTGTNKGFRARNNTVYTYSQLKSGFTYFYPKRKVLADGVRTTYLDI